MFYPYAGKQTLLQWLFNTLDPRIWNDSPKCECCWQYMPFPNLLYPDTIRKVWVNKLVFIVLGGCPYHD